MLLRLGGSFEQDFETSLGNIERLSQKGEGKEIAFESLRQVNSEPVWAPKEVSDNILPHVVMG